MTDFIPARLRDEGRELLRSYAEEDDDDDEGHAPQQQQLRLQLEKRGRQHPCRCSWWDADFISRYIFGVVTKKPRYLLLLLLRKLQPSDNDSKRAAEEEEEAVKFIKLSQNV